MFEKFVVVSVLSETGNQPGSKPATVVVYGKDAEFDLLILYWSSVPFLATYPRRV